MIDWLNECIASPSIQRFGWCLIHSVWQIGLISITAVVGMVAVSSLRARSRSYIRYNVAIVSLIMCVVFPMATWFFIDVSKPTQMEANPEVTSGSLGISSFNENAAMDLASLPVESSSWQESVVAIFEPWTPMLTAVWIFGVLLFSMRPLIGLQAIWRLERTGHSPIDEASRCMFERLVASMKVCRSVRIAESSLAQVPMVVGFFKPLILVPASTLIGLGSSELEAVIAHELAHLKRYDDLVNLLQTGIETVLFFHPCVWWLSSVARAERENCCDDIAVSTCGNPSTLAKALLALEQTQHIQPALAANGGSLVKRVRRLKEIKMNKKNVFQRFSSIIFLVTTVLISTLIVSGFVYSTHLEAQESVQQVDEDKSEKTEAVEDDKSEAEKPVSPAKAQADGTPATIEDSDRWIDWGHERPRLMIPELTQIEITGLRQAIPKLVGNVEVGISEETGRFFVAGSREDVIALKKYLEQLFADNSTKKDRGEILPISESEDSKHAIPKLNGRIDIRVSEETGTIIMHGDKEDIGAVKNFVDKVIIKPLDSRNGTAAKERQDPKIVLKLEAPDMSASMLQDLKKAVLENQDSNSPLAIQVNEESGITIIGYKQDVDAAEETIRTKLDPHNIPAIPSNERLVSSSLKEWLAQRKAHSESQSTSNRTIVDRVQLKHRPAEEMAYIVQQLFEGTGSMGDLQIKPVGRDNSLILIGLPSGIGFAKTLIKLFDVGVEKRVRQREQKNANGAPDMEPFFQVYRLNHCSPELANDVIGTLVKQRKDMVNTRIDTDNKKGQLFIHGPESAHKQVAKVLATIDVVDPAANQLEVVIPGK